ncbi:hypothetical protein [Corynebacterium lowii]|uniref:Uncharacterized protein n=1 Tax=Corynebacterium lowii TaxID=1544413 RepID=A0A0N8W0H2_9CORY|nr:hypothetical protein [Corynebacterium lowii]KQB86690.1 hypothetical protein Clow_00898 [Corynebacterium lowii]MDP9851375.1 hypothetical protein [Corynebacterium lowii]
MPQIQFDVLIPDARAEELRGAFNKAGQRLQEAGRVREIALDYDPEPAMAAGVTEQLSEIFEREHEGKTLEQARVRRYTLSVEGVAGSVNELTMSLSRILTPQADLPHDPVLLENEAAHEQPAHYPWTVEVRR